MRYFTNNPLERLMMQTPRPMDTPRQARREPPKDHPCYGCKHCGEVCVLPCYRGVTVTPPIKGADRSHTQSR